MRKEFPMLLTVVAALTVILSQFFFHIAEWNLMDVLDKWLNVMWGIAIGLGIVNLSVVHGKKIMRRAPGFYNSVVLLAILYVYAILGLWTTTQGYYHAWIFDNVYAPLDSTVFGLVAFFITTAAYRAFKVRTWEATVMLLAGMILLLGSAPIGEAIWADWAHLRQWFLDIPNAAGMRGIVLGIYLGGFATALRVMLGLERAWMGAMGGR
ncbi:MAG: hypothetical protein RDU89_03710 [bacterium]|nr:hypothetical protein [bacterium]